MPSKKAEMFRNFLAERGTEMTPDEAKEVYKSLKSLIKVARGLSLKEIWEIGEHNKDYAELYMKAKEI